MLDAPIISRKPIDNASYGIKQDAGLGLDEGKQLHFSGLSSELAMAERL